MKIVAVLLAAAFAVPSLARAEVWRWRDAAGELHYSNVAAHVPSHAAQVTRPIGQLSLAPAEPSAAAPREPGPRSPRQEESTRPAFGGNRFGCHAAGVPFLWEPGFSAPWVLRLNGDNLADQVKEASLLDALNVRWRGSCWR